VEPISRVSGRMAPLDRADVDTDQIIPKQFLKRIERTGYGPFLFFDWRAGGDFVLDRPEHKGASVLVTGANFGCGSSREHAPWAIRDAGYRAIVAPSFADIFRANCYKTGLLAVTLPERQVRHLIDLASEDPRFEVTVDLEANEVRGDGFAYSFDMDAFARDCMLRGLDDIGLVERHEPDITAFEARRPAWLPAVGAAPTTIMGSAHAGQRRSAEGHVSDPLLPT
jgi:3-isopropylmalate/(R)-2-methylmalate dehydratase small subunit